MDHSASTGLFRTLTISIARKINRVGGVHSGVGEHCYGWITILMFWIVLNTLTKRAKLG